MRLTTSKSNLYVVLGAKYKDTARLGREGARFAWDPEGTKTGVSKSWWTNKIERACKLLEYADDTCRQELEEYEKTQTTRVRRSRALDGGLEVPMPDGLRLYNYQRAGVDFLYHTPRALLGDEMGLGKTPMCLGLVNRLEYRVADGVGEASGGEESNLQVPTATASILVICPASLKINWVRESRRFLVRPRQIEVITAATQLGALSKRIESGDPTLVVVNPELLTKKSNYKVTEAKPEVVFGEIDTFVRGIKWDIIVVDEAHMYKNPNTKRTIALFGRPAIPAKRGKAKSFPQPAIGNLVTERAVLATGTPFPNYPIEIQPLAAYLHPEFSGYWEFAQKYCNMHQTQFGVDVKGASNMSLLQERLRSTIMIRRTKDEALPDLPPKVRQVIDFPAEGMAQLIKAESRAVEDHFNKITRFKTATGGTVSAAQWQAAVSTLNADLKVSFRELSRVRAATALAKVPRCVEYIRDSLETGAIVKLGVFAHHRNVIEAYTEAFKDFGSVCLYGGMSAKKRQASVDRFQTDPDCRVFVGSIMAAGVGLTLTAASDVFFGELDWVPGNVSQAEDRFHRVTQDNVVFVRHLVVDGSLDSRMAKKLVEKQENIDAGLDNNSALDIPQTLGYDTQDATEKQMNAINLGLDLIVTGEQE